MTPRTMSAIVAVAIVVVAGCSSSDDTASSTTIASTTTPATAPSTTAAPVDTTPDTTAPPTTLPPATTEPPATTTPDDETELTAAELADQELARTAMITLEDFPEGWTETPKADDGDSQDNAAFEAEFDLCLGRSDDNRIRDDLDRLAVTTGDFHPTGNDATSVSHEVTLAPDEATAIEAMSEVSVEGAETCLADVIQRFYETTFAEDPELAEIGIGEVVVTRTVDDRDTSLGVGLLVEIPLVVGEDSVSQFLEVVYQRRGRALGQLSFSSLGSPFDRDGHAALTDEAVAGLTEIGS